MSSCSFVCVFPRCKSCLKDTPPLNDVLRNPQMKCYHDYFCAKKKTPDTNSTNHILFLVADYEKMRNRHHQILIFALTVSSAMDIPGPSAAASPARVPHTQDLPISCAKCYVNYREFVSYYFGHPERLINFAQDHGMIKTSRQCRKCSSECRLHVNRKAFRI